jgi:hypothetical protein
LRKATEIGHLSIVRTWLRTRTQPGDVRRILARLGRRERRLSWLRRLPPRDLDALVHRIEGDLAANPTRDSLLEHLARLHFTNSARVRTAGNSRVLEGDADDARCAVLAVVFHRRYGERMLDALGPPETLDDEWERANLYVEGALRRLDVAYVSHGPGHWLLDAPSLAVHLHHYPAARILDLYAPLVPVPSDGSREELFEELLAANGGSIAGAFYGICSFGDGGDHICSCARLATEHVTGPDLVYAVNSVVTLAERFREGDPLT